MSDTRDTFVSEIYVNNEQARDAIAELTSEVDRTAKAYEKLLNTKNADAAKTEKARKAWEAATQSLANARKGTEAYATAMKDLAGKSMQNLVRMQRQIKSELDKTKPNTAEWNQLAKAYQDVTNRMKALNAAQNGVTTGTGKLTGSMGGLMGKLGSLGSMVTAIPTILKGVKIAIQGITYAAKEVIKASQTMGDKWNNGMEAMKTTTHAFWAALSSGDWSVFNEGIDNALARARLLAEQMDLIGSYGISKGYMESKYLVEYQQAMTNARNKNMSDEQRNEWADIAAQRLKEYNDFLNDEQTETMKALRLNFETLKGLTFDTQEEFEAFMDRLYKDAFVNRDKEVKQAKKDFEDFKNLRVAEILGEKATGGMDSFWDVFKVWEGDGSKDIGQSAADVINAQAQATEEAFAKIEKEYGHMVAQLLQGIEIVDDDHKKLISTYASHQSSIRQVAKSERQLNEVRAQLKVETDAYAKAVREADTEEETAMTDAKKRYADGLIDKATYESETSRIGSEARQKRKEANIRYMKEDLDALNLRRAQEEILLANQYRDGLISLQEYEEKLAQIKEAAKEEQLDIERRYGEDLKKIEKQQYEERIRERERLQSQYDQAYQKAQAKVEKQESKQKLFWKQQYAAGLIDKQTYEARIAVVEEDFLKQKMATAMKYGKDTDQFMSQLLDRQITRMEKAKAMLKEEMDEMTKYQSNLESEEEGRFATENPYKGKSAKELEEDALTPKDDFQAAIWQKAADIREAITEDSARTQYETEMAWAEKLAKDGKITAEEAEKYKLKIKIDYAQKAASQVNQIAEMASNFVTQLKDMETAQLESEYQAQLTAAGDNAEQREAIEAEYEQKKLDLQKKYADTEMVVNIAKAIAAGALAAVEAFAAAGNPILGAVFAAIVAATTALEVATIVKQRNAIKNSSVSSSSSSSSSAKTGTRTITGYAEGGYTEDHTTLTTVGERGREWVGPAWMVKKNPVMFANLERYRKAGSHGRSGSVSSGFADGGFAGGDGSSAGSGSANLAIDIEAAVETAIRRSMADGAIRAYLVRKDLTELDNQTERFKNQTSR